MISRALAIAVALSIAAFADSAAGIRWTQPPSWNPQPARPMRAATYVVPSAQSAGADGECAVYYFGPHQGGTVDANVKRWIGQFEGEKNAETAKRAIHGLKVTTVEASGAYSGMGGPMAPTKTVQPDYRLLGAIVEAPEGLVFFKFTGPAATVAANQSKFDAMLNSLAPGR